VVAIRSRSLPLSYEFVGEVQPIKRVEVRARVDGVIESRPFTEGAFVRAGEVLYRLERVRYDAAYRSAAARVANAKRTLERLEPLLVREAVALQDVDDARTELESAEAALDEARKDREDAVVRAEISGRVGRTRLEVGARVTGPADLLTTVEQVDPVYITFRPSTQDLLRWRQDPASRDLIRPGSTLRIRVVLPDGTELPREGRLDFVSSSLDPATGTQEFRASLTNRDLLLVPGQFVRVRLEGFSRDSALAVPRRAVQQALGRQFVLVVGKGDTIAARDVQPGPWSGDAWIIERGLALGDQVVVDGVQKALPGRVVRPVPLPDSTATPGAGGSETEAGGDQ
jgi:membrane fusion protein (multidrug efflux system)